MPAEDRDEIDKEELRQMLRYFRRDLYTWISQTHEIVEELNLLSKDLDEHFRNINIAKVSGAAGAVAGGVMTVFALKLSPFTFGGPLALSLAGGALAGAAGVRVGGSAAVNAELAKTGRETAESLLRKYSDMSSKIKHRCLFISTMLETYGEIGNDFPDWLQFWAKAVKGTDDCSDWKDILKILDSALNIYSASLRATAQAALRLAGADATVGLHVVGGVAGGVAGLLFTPQDVLTLVDSAIDIHKKNPHQVSNDIRSLADNIKKICPTQKDVDKMINCTIAKL